MEIVQVQNLKKMYGEIAAVRGISFGVRRGEIFGFLGPNGAGKTSTINMLVGLTKPSAGQIRIDGLDALAETKKVQGLLGIVPDENNLYEEMDGFANLCFCASLYGLGKKEREQKARELLRTFGLAEVSKRPFRAYSRGMKRKLTIAAGLIHDPQILFLDEPTTGIDVESARQIRKLILDFKKQKKTIFMTTHYLEEAERICDRVAFIVEGRLVKIASLNNFREGAPREYKIKLVLEGDIRALKRELEQNLSDCRVEIPGENCCVLRAQKRVALAPVLQMLADWGISVYEAREIKPSLEEIFLEITKRKKG